MARRLEVRVPAADGHSPGTLHVPDADAYADFLLARPEVSGPAIGTTGYCLGGRMSLVAAGGHGRDHLGT
jgi:dienelactone hydrolase